MDECGSGRIEPERDNGVAIRVLIVDDSARARAGLRALLATWPEVEVVGEATNGQEAVRQVEEQAPTLVLMDLRMPRMDGVQATRQIKARWPEVSIVVVTISTAAEPDALAAGADAFVVKGDAPERLRTALRACQHASKPSAYGEETFVESRPTTHERRGNTSTDDRTVSNGTM